MKCPNCNHEFEVPKPATKKKKAKKSKASPRMVNGIYGYDNEPSLAIENGWVINGHWNVWIPEGSDGTVVQVPHTRKEIHFICSFKDMKAHTNPDEWSTDYNWLLNRARDLISGGELTTSLPWPEDTADLSGKTYRLYTESSKKRFDVYDDDESIDDIPF